MGGEAAYSYIKHSVELAQKGMIDAVATTPINKESLKWQVLTVLDIRKFCRATNTNDPLTMFEVQDLRVFFLTRHVSLKQACSWLIKKRY